MKRIKRLSITFYCQKQVLIGDMAKRKICNLQNPIRCHGNSLIHKKQSVEHIKWYAYFSM